MSRERPQVRPSSFISLNRDADMERCGAQSHGGLVAVFVVAAIARLAYLAIVPPEPIEPPSDAFYFSRIAENLIEGNGYVSTAARAYQPPGYPAFLALIYSLVGVRFDLARVVLAVVGALQCVASTVWASRLGSRRIGYLAGIVMAIYPPFVRFPQTLFSETLYLAILAVSMLALIRARSRPEILPWISAGILFGLAALTREMTLVMPAVVALWLWFAKRSMSGQQCVIRWLVFTTAMTLTIAPWTLRNYVVLGGFVPISTNAGINFYIGNNSKATGTLWDSRGALAWRVAPGVDWQDGANELAAHRRGLAEGVRHIATNPSSTLALWAKKLWILWRPPFHGYTGNVTADFVRSIWLMCYLAIWLFALCSLAVLGPSWTVQSLPLLMIVAFSAPYIAAYAEPRYRLPMESLLIYYSAIGLDVVIRRFIRTS